MAVKATSQVSLTDVTDAYSVTLTSEAYVFMGDNESGAPAGLSCTTQVIAYRGSQQCTNINVGKIQCPTGISAKIENNGTSVPTITFATTAAITDSCEATIPVTVDDVSFTKIFSFAIATSVNDAKLELYLKKDEYGTLKSMIEEIADVINITAKGGLNLSGNRFTLDSTNTKISADGTILSKNAIGTASCEIKGGHLKVNAGSYELYLAASAISAHLKDGTNNKDYILMQLGWFDNNGGSLYLMRRDGTTGAYLSANGNILLNNTSKKEVVNLSVHPGGSGQLFLRSSFGNDAIRLYGYANGINSGYIEIWKNGSDRTILLDGYDGGGYFRKIEVQSARLGTTSFVGDGIEIYHTYPHIDFHKDNNNADFTARLIEEISGAISLRCLGNGMGWFHAGGYAQDSSKYIKKNIQDIPEDEALKLLKLRPVSFDYKKGDTNRRGLIAEEVMDIYPELVQIPDGYDEDTFEYDEEGPNLVPSLDYSGFIPYLIKMVQIQQKEIEDLKEQVLELSKRLV